MIGPELEKLLLDGNARWHNAALGYGSLICLQVPKGKSYVITEINIEPFFNIINTAGTFAPNNTFKAPILSTGSFDNVLERLEFNLSVYNRRLNERYIFRNEMFLSTAMNQAESDFYSQPGIALERKKIKCFYLIEEPTFFFFSFPNFIDLQFSVQTNPLSTVFNVNDFFPETPAGYVPAFQTIEAVVIPVLGGYTYLPLGIADTNTTYNNLTDTIAYPTIAGGTAEATQLILPVAPNALTNLVGAMLPSLPVLNISYIEINKRSTTDGI